MGGETQESETAGKPTGDRLGLVIGGALLAACAGLVLYGVLGTGKDDSTPERRIPTGLGPDHRHVCLRELALLP